MVDFEIFTEEFIWYENGKYSLPTEDGKLILAKDAVDDLFELPVKLLATGDIDINENMLIEDLVDIGGQKQF